MQLYPQSKPAPDKTAQRSSIDPALYLVPTPYYPPQFATQFGYQQQQPSINIVKEYNINTAGPIENHSMLNLIYEDALPIQGGNLMAGNPATIADRLILLDYVRSSMFANGDENDIGMDGKSDRTLLSWIKFLDLNPYNMNKFSKNPYKGLPKDMLMYRTCYPIKYDTKTSSVQCALNSMGMNVKIIKLTVNEYEKKKLNSDAWNEVEYYKYIKETIIKPKRSPNFVNMFGYYKVANSQIDFDKINADILRKNKTVDEIKKEKNKYTDLDSEEKKIYENTIRHQFLMHPNQNQMMTVVKKNNPDAYVGNALVILTEAPQYSILEWASKIYKRDGKILKQIQTGVYEKKIWESIIFQMLIIFNELKKHGISMSNFNIESNFFIKDLKESGKNTRHWKYNVGGFEFYIPNYGYLVLFDSSFYKSDVQKIVLKTGADSDITRMFNNTFDSDNFTNSNFVNNGGNKPPAEIIKLFSDIRGMSTSGIIDVMNILKTDDSMRKFLNNRIGTKLDELENKPENIRPEMANDLKQGDICVHEVAGTHTFVCIIDKDVAAGTFTILTKTNGAFAPMSNVSSGDLKGFSKLYPIAQSFNEGESTLSNDDILETYYLN